MKRDLRIRIAIQKDGRLTDDSLNLLRKIGLNFESYKQKLYVSCKNAPVDILYVRDDDIPSYVARGAADLGMVGQNVVFESREKVTKALNLRFGFCTLSVAVPENSTISSPTDLQGKTIATSFPRATNKFFDEMNIKVKIIKIAGSVEIAPFLGVADAIADLVATGSTLKLNGLKKVFDIYQTEAVLIKGRKNTDAISEIISKIRNKLSTQNYKTLSFVIPAKQTNKCKKIISEIKDTISFPLNTDNETFVQGAVKGDLLEDCFKKLKKLGARRIIVSTIEQYLI